MRAVDLIARKRDGEELPAGELAALVLAYARDEVPDYQVAALLMAIVFQGLSEAETFALTDAMVRSGETLDLSSLGTVVDKHSTGGVGDKTSIALGPVVAACGVPFAKMSGRGLGHTGGTVDKLEAIPGFRVELAPDAFVRQVADVGLAIVGQSPLLTPADGKLYALRDVTATVEEVSLIGASVMSKKIAAGADAILLDVKVGEGAFMKRREDARRLAGAMLALGRRAGRAVVCELTDMGQPLGRAVGNALEVREAVATLRGEGPADFAELVLGSAATLLALADPALDEAAGRERAERAVASGAALEAYERWVCAQGGDPAEERLPRAPVVRVVAAPGAGHVQELDALAVGHAAVLLGAGRATKADAIDPATGVVCLAKHGDPVEPGQPLAEVHARSDEAAAAAERALIGAYRLGPEPPAPRPLVLETLR
ncbi:MAG: thymidine phosphorylase [Thermoleophilia bacterium]